MRELGETELGGSLHLEALRQSHLEDGPSTARRAQLLARINQAAEPLLEQPSAPAAQLVQPARDAVFVKRRWLSATIFGLAAAGATLSYGLGWLRGSSVMHSDRVTSATRSAEVVPATERAQPVAEHAPAAVTTVPCGRARGDDGLLADFEHAEEPRLQIPARDGRSGEWFHQRQEANNATRSEPLLIQRSPEANAQNRVALRVAGPPPAGWGASAGIRFDRCYDASAYAGITLRLRGKGVLFVGFQTLETVPVEFGGRCTERCWFTGGRHIALSDHFETHRILWKDIGSPSPSQAIPRELLQVMFLVEPGPERYEFWLDDLRFMPAE